jgi:hypothetical protein
LLRLLFRSKLKAALGASTAENLHMKSKSKKDKMTLDRVLSRFGMSSRNSACEAIHAGHLLQGIASKQQIYT